MKLYGTFPSHFSRKVRILLQELGLDYEFVVLTNILDVGSEFFAGNPLHQYPVLELNGKRIIESDIICEHLLWETKKISLFPDHNTRTDHQQRLAIINGAMASGVKIIRAQRSAIPNLEDFTFFKQERAAIDSSLAWLEKDLGPKTTYASGEFDLLDISLMCLLEWALFRKMVNEIESYPNLKRFVQLHEKKKSYYDTHPAREGVKK